MPKCMNNFKDKNIIIEMIRNNGFLFNKLPMLLILFRELGIYTHAPITILS